MLQMLGEIPAYAAHQYGDRIALVAGGCELTFREIDGLSATLAANLVKQGVAPGDRVTLYAPNSWEWIVSYYGALRAGAIINPVNVMLTPSEVAYVLLKSDAVQDVEGILALCRQELAAYKQPRAVRFVPDLPKTSTGKIMRRELGKL